MGRTSVAAYRANRPAKLRAAVHALEVVIPAMLEQMAGYADLVLDACVPVRPDELVLIDAEVEHAPLARALTEAAYTRGAGYVDIRYDEPRAELSRVRHAAAASLSTRPDWLESRYRAPAVLIEITGPSEPNLLTGEDRARLISRPGRELVGCRTVVPYPTQGWAQAVYGVPDVIRLWTHLRDLLRLDDPDPAGTWQARIAEAGERADRLTGLGLEAIRLAGPDTDLTVGLRPGARWTTARRDCPAGRSFLSRLPADRLYLTADRVDGKVRRLPVGPGPAQLALVAGSSPVDRCALTSAEDTTELGSGLTATGIRAGQPPVVLLAGDSWQI